ncbi:hypothetical protein pb186bvf_015513 [Paramecium bursaria]
MIRIVQSPSLQNFFDSVYEKANNNNSIDNSYDHYNAKNMQ